MTIYYELMVLTRRDAYTNEFKDGDELDELARNGNIDSESETVSSAIGIIRWLVKNDESVKGKYLFQKKK